MRRFRSAVFLFAAALFLSACGRQEAPAASSSKPFITYGSSRAESVQAETSSAEISSAETSSSGFTGMESHFLQSEPFVPESSAPPEPTTVKVSIPEGFSVPQIAKRLEEKKVCKAADFLSAVNNYDFSPFDYAPLLSGITSLPKRWYRLEGYLCPATYEFYIDMEPHNAVGKMLRAAYNSYGNKYAYPGWTFDQVLTLASIIEKETGKTSEMKKISSVFHNRLKKGIQLKSDATIYYIENYVRLFLTPAQHKANQDNNVYKDYNTYKCKALPAGPICSPSPAALDAAAHPADTPYLFFKSDANGVYHYSETGSEHVASK